MEVLLLILDGSKDTLLGGVGGFIGGLYHFHLIRQKNAKAKIDLTDLCIHTITGVFMAFCLSPALPSDAEYRRVLIGTIGLSGLPLIGLLQSKAITKLTKLLDKF